MKWENPHLNLTINDSDGVAVLTNPLSGDEITISLRSPKLDLGDSVSPGAERPINLTRKNTRDGPRWTGWYSPVKMDGIEAHISIWLQAYKKKPYVRKGYEVVFKRAPDKLPFREIEMDRVELAGLSPSFTSRGDFSTPILSNSFFMGVEFPMSIARLENTTAVLASRPGIYLKTGQAFKSRDLIYAVVEPGNAEAAFREYVEEFRAKPAEIFFGYNNWWTTPLHQTSEIIVDLAKSLKTNLFDPYGVAPEVFTLDLGWSDPHTVWEIDRKAFPNGFSDITDILDKMGTRIGIWISVPSSYPDGLDNKWAVEQGYESFKFDHWVDQNLCCAGPKYNAAFTRNTLDIVRKHQARNIKFDAQIYHCPSSDHSHMPGEYSAEPMAQTMIDYYAAARAASPEMRIYTPQKDRPNTFQGEYDCRFEDVKGGPWWMKYTHFISCMEADDYPYGRCPAPVHRDTYTNARAFRVLKSATDPLIPVDCKEAFGIISQTEESLANDAVDVLMRGHLFISLYLNVYKMSPDDWEFIAKIIKYGRANKNILRNTTTLFPDSWKQADGSIKYGRKAMRDPYGFAHIDGKRTLLYLRNPSINEQSKTIRLDKASGFLNSDLVWNAVSIFPCKRTYGRNLRYGDEITIQLQPHQNVLIELNAKEATAPDYVSPDKLSVLSEKHEITKIRKPGEKATAKLSCSVEAQHGLNKLMVLVETDKEPESQPTVKATVDGNESPIEMIATKDGWHQDGGPPPENWTWHIMELPRGKSSVELSVEITSDDAELSVWLWGESPMKNPGRSPLIHPKPVERESVPLLATTVMHE
jgi:hypothetical protein